MIQLLLINPVVVPAWLAVAAARASTDRIETISEPVHLPEGQRAAEHFLSRLDTLLRAHPRQLEEFEGLAMAIGPGRFTTLRTTTAAANALALARGLPLVKVPAGQSVTPVEMAAAAAAELAAGRTHRQLLPDYGQEPSITPPRL